MTRPDHLSTVFLGLGANVGDRLSMLGRAVARLSQNPQIHVDESKDLASIYETQPVGGPSNQGLFLNTVVRVATSLTPRGMLQACLEVEQALGRVRGERNGPRVIDIDILLFENLLLLEDDLIIPHPRLHERLFVLEPLSELAGAAIHPLFTLPIAQLRDRLRSAVSGPAVMVRVWAGGWGNILSAAQNAVTAGSR